jgi:hypothetical protein
MLSPHEFATLMLVAAAPEQIDLNREYCWTVNSSRWKSWGPELNAPVLPATAIQFFARLRENPELRSANKVVGHVRATSGAYLRSIHEIALYHAARRQTGAPAPDVSPRDGMHFYHHGVAIQPSVARIRPMSCGVKNDGQRVTQTRAREDKKRSSIIRFMPTAPRRPLSSFQFRTAYR